ncbi:MAG: hypothetical protein Q9222_005805 [Ikaeria aurantiellina]
MFLHAAWALAISSTSNAAACPTFSSINRELGQRLTPGSSISNNTAGAPRWSLYHAPKPAFVVNVQAEEDVAATVRYCNKRNIPFLTQGRGNGWADTFHLGDCGLLINLAGLDSITFNESKDRATIQGGVLVGDMIASAYGNNTRFAVPTCTCLGYFGSMLGGGINRMMGLYGLGVDQFLSVSIVTASGQLLQIDSTSDRNLWYAIRGAVANFGVATSATVKAYPTQKSQNIAWTGAITFPETKLEALIEVIHGLHLRPEMQIDFLFATSGPTSTQPMITAIPFYLGNASESEKAFAPVLNLGSISNTAEEIPYSNWGDFGESFCVKGERKPAYGASIGVQGLDPTTWRALFDEFKAFVTTYPQAAGSSVLAEYYPLEKAIQLGRQNPHSSYPFRDVPIHVVAIPLYENKSLDAAANAFGSRFRELLQSTDGLRANSTYINFAHGDEPLEEVYGKSLTRLQRLKKRYDPYNRFGQWFSLA